MRFSSSTRWWWLATSALLAACSGDDADVFGESSSATGAGASGSSGDGGASGSGTQSSGTQSSGTQSSGTQSSGTQSSGTQSSVTTGDGGAGSSVTTGDGGAGSVTTVGATTASVATSTAAGPTCGDGSIDGTDQCDGADLGGQTCASLGFPAGGVLGCSNSCTFDTTACDRCGDGVLDGGEACDDGNLAANDGCSASCTFEGTTCNTPIDLQLDRGDVVTIATTNAMGAAANGSCSNGQGPGRVIRVDPAASGFLRAWVKRGGTTFDSTLRIGYGCQQTFVCTDSYDPDANNGAPQPAGGEVGSLFVAEGQTTYVIVEAWGAGEVGDFEIELTLERGNCEQPVTVPVEPGSSEGIANWGRNAQQGGDVVGSCGGNGEDVTYQLQGVGADVVDLSLEVVEGAGFNPVLHARDGDACTSQDAEIECAANTGFGGTEQLFDLDLGGEPFVFADATQNSQGGYVLRVIPPRP